MVIPCARLVSSWVGFQESWRHKFHVCLQDLDICKLKSGYFDALARLGILTGAPLYWKTLPVQTTELLTTLTWAAREYSHILFLFRALVSIYMYFGARRDSKKEGATPPFFSFLGFCWLVCMYVWSLFLL